MNGSIPSSETTMKIEKSYAPRISEGVYEYQGLKIIVRVVRKSKIARVACLFSKRESIILGNTIFIAGERLTQSMLRTALLRIRNRPKVLNWLLTLVEN
jgi:hypothetical protein